MASTNPAPIASERLRLSLLSGPARNRWNIVTGTYDRFGGVDDYTRMMAGELVRSGDEVRVWAPSSPQEAPAEDGIEVRRLPDNFGPRSLRIVDRALGRRARSRLLVQYVPQAYGWRAMNLPFCLWLYSRRNCDEIDVIFHEVAAPVGRNLSLRHNLLGGVTRAMAWLVARSAHRIFTSTTSWEVLLRPMIGAQTEITWLPVFSNVPIVNDPLGVAAIAATYAQGGRRLAGHFGTYGRMIPDYLGPIIKCVMRRCEDLSFLLLGKGGLEFQERLLRQDQDLAPRIFATGELDREDLSRHIQACDLAVQPYPDGITTRRTSALAALAHGVPVITNKGFLTERLWSERGEVVMARSCEPATFATLIEELLADDRRLREKGFEAKSLYDHVFSIDHAIAVLKHDE